MLLLAAFASTAQQESSISGNWGKDANHMVGSQGNQDETIATIFGSVGSVCFVRGLTSLPHLLVHSDAPARNLADSADQPLLRRVWIQRAVV